MHKLLTITFLIIFFINCLIYRKMRKLKLILASLAIALCGFSQAFAADWSAATLEAGKHYFLNVGANKWWGAGNSWGTQASLLPHPEYLTVIVDGSNYKVESQVSNGGTNYYFNGSFMDNGSPVSLTIETDGTNYSIANGTTYYGYDGSTTVLATSDNRDSDNFKWQIFNEAQMRARLEAASSSNPVDATYLILDQGFSRNQRNKSAWTMDASNKNLGGGDNTNMCAESWHSTFTLSQKLENVPNGLYTLTAQGFYRQDGSDNDNLPYFYINDAKGTFPILSGSENNMTDASNSFTAGKYTISPISVLVTDGTITLGAKNEVNTSLWCIFDNFTLTFYGDTDPLEASKNQIKAVIDEAEAIDVNGLPAAVVDEMKAIVDPYKTAYESYTTQAEFDQAVVAIKNAMLKVQAYNKAKDCVAKLKAILEATNVYTQEAYETIYANVTKFENAELTVDEANAMTGAIFGTGWHSTAAIDDFLISAWDVAPRTWDSYHVNTWSTTGDSGNPNMFTPCFEYWTGDGEKLADKVMTATVAGLAPNVKYSVSILACPAVNTGENGVAPTGIELQVGEGTPVSLCTGARIGETRFYEGTFTAEGTADAEGNLVIKINVAGTNASWLTFRNVKYEKLPEVSTWKDIKVDFTNNQILTEAETNIISVGIKMNEDGTATRVAADDASANAVVTGKWHSTQHGLANFSATVKVEGPVKIGMGSCAWGGNVTVKDENGVEVANAFNTNNGACWATKDGADKNVIYTYYKGEAATLTIAGGSYTPYFSVEKIALEDIPQVMKVSYSLGESGATGILPANFELDGGKTFTLPVNRTLYVEGKTLTGWTDGTKTYAIGEEVTAVADTEISFAPVFTDNTVSLADRKDTVNIVWDFQQKNGAPVVAVQGKTMFWIAQAVVNGDTIDVKMDIDATSGKVANGNWTDWAQINGGTKLTIPAAKGAVISMESYSATTTTTIAGEVINQGTTKPVYTYTGEEATVDIVIGDGSYWRTVAVAIPAVAVDDAVTVTTYDFEDDNILFTCDSRISASVVSGEQTIKGTNENTITLESKAVRFAGANNAQNGYSFAHYDFTSLVEKAKNVKVEFDYWNTDGARAIISIGDASVRGTTGNSSKNTYSNKGAIFALGSDKNNALLNGAKLAKGDYCDKWLNVSVTVDVLNSTYSYTIKNKADGTEIKSESDIAYYNSEALACSQIDLFGYINNSTPALLDNIVITVEKDNRVYADYKVTYVDESGAEIKDATVRNGAANEAAEVVNSDKESFKNADGTKKYIYKSDDSEGKTIAEDGSTIITVTFREAAKYNYSVEAVNEAGELMSSLGEYSDFEGENAKAPYNTYVLNESDSTLYEAAKTGKEYNKYVALTEDNMKVQVTYTKSSISNVVYYQEAENVWGLTKATNGNTGIRSSNSASAYAAEEDVELTSLSTGKYKMTAVICDAKTDKSGSFSFTAKADTILTVNTVDVNWTSGTSEEFTVIGNTPISLVKGGNDMQAVDFFYIQKTGVVPPTEVANIAALKDVQEGMEVKLALTDAVVNIWSGDVTAQSMASYVEDATGAIKFDISLSNMEWMRDSIAMNGYIYASYGKDYDGIPQLSVSDSTGASKVDTVAAVPASKVMTVADASNETALSRYVKFEKVEFVKKVVDDWGTTECYLVQGTDTITFFDKFSRFGWNAMPDFKSFDEVQGFISVYEGKFEFYPYGEYKANYTPAVVAENIAAVKAVENGTNVNLTLKDAKITAYVSSKWGGATAYIEDASGAIQIAGDVLSQFGVENDSTILNGNIYVKYVNEWGSIQLSAGDSLAFSKVEAKEGAVSPTTMAVKDIKAETNVARYVEIAFPSFKYDAENYFYYAAQNGDTIMVVDNFGWMSSNFDLDEEYNLILPDSVSSIRGIVMWDDWNGYSIVPTGIDEFVAPQDIVVNVAEGDIAAAVETAKAAVKKVGKITINLTEGAAYTVNSSIVAPAGVVINGNGATVDASASTVNIIEGVAEAPAAWEVVDSIAVKDVTIKGLGKALYYSAAKNRNITNFLVDNSVVEVVKDVTIFDFTKGSVAMNFVVKNSTLYAPTATTKSVYSSQGGQKATEADAAAVQTFGFENSTIYNITSGKNFFTHRQNSQKWLKYVIKNNVVVNSGKANFMQSINGGGNSANPVYEVTTNSVGTLADGVYTDLSASQTVQDNVMGTLVTSDPMFKDVAAGDFTLGEASEQNVNKLGDPRWFAAAPAPSVAYLCGSTTAPDEAIYNALVAAQYDVTPLNYDEVTLTEEIVMNDFAGKYDVVVLAGGTGSGTNLAKSANILLGKVNVLSTKSFWYKHYGTNGGNPGSADAPSLSVAVSEGYAEHPLFTGIDGAEFAVFNDMGKSTGRYLQSNGSFADEAYAQTTIATTLGADCIGEAWAGDYGYVIIPVDGAQPEGYLTEDGKKLFVNAVQYLIDGVKFTTGIDGINSNVNVLNGDVYSINGIKVRKAGESLKGLAKGMYIVNGKKFIVK